jgi:hypothetical protein
MISFLRLTLKRANGCVSLQLRLTMMPAKRASLRSASRNASTSASVPARNRFTPSGATRIVPRNAMSAARSRSVAASASASSTGTKW